MSGVNWVSKPVRNQWQKTGLGKLQPSTVRLTNLRIVINKEFVQSRLAPGSVPACDSF